MAVASTGSLGRTPTRSRPHRAHRTLRSSPWHALESVLVLVGGYAIVAAALLFVWTRGCDAVTAFVTAHAATAGHFNDRIAGVLSVLPIVRLAPLSLFSALTIGSIAAGVLLVAALLPGRHGPLRHWIAANALVLAVTGLWAFFTGAVAYDGASFMELVERTSVLLILAIPLFSTAVTMVLPFSLFERFVMIVLLCAAEIALGLVRIAAFSVILDRAGVIAEPNLYLFFGPLIDVSYLIGAYAIAAWLLARRTARDREAWAWR